MFVDDALLLFLVGLHGGALEGEEKGRDELRSSLALEGRTQAMQHHQTGSRGFGHHRVVNQSLAAQAVDVCTMGMRIHGILEEKDAANLSADQESNQLCVSSEGTRGTRRTMDDRAGGFVLEDFLEHCHGAVRSSETKLLKDVLVGLNEFAHVFFHTVV